MASCSHCSRLYPLRILSRKWSYLVLRALREPLTFSELQRELKYVTNHILTRELKLLGEEQLIVHDKKYRLTPAGQEFYKAVEPLTRWCVKNMGTAPCPSDKKCSTCPGYPQAVAIRAFEK